MDVKVRGDLPEGDPAIAPAVDVPVPVQGYARVSLVQVGLFGLTVAAILLLGIVIGVARCPPGQATRS